MAAEKGGATGLDNPLDQMAAAWGFAQLVFAAIDLKVMLKIAELAIHMHIIAQSRAAALDGAPKDGFDGWNQPFRPPPWHGSRQALGRNPGFKLGCTLIDVS